MFISPVGRKRPAGIPFPGQIFKALRHGTHLSWLPVAVIRHAPREYSFSGHRDSRQPFFWFPDGLREEVVSSHKLLQPCSVINAVTGSGGNLFS